MRAFEIHKPKEAPPPPPKPERRSRRRRWLLALLLLLLAGGIGVAVRPDPKVARARELQAEMFAGPPTPETKAKMDEFRQVMSTMTRDQKDQLFAPMREKMKADFDKYFTLSPKEKQQVLDSQIDREEKWKKEREKSGKTNGGQGGPPGGGGGFGGPRGGGPKTPDQVKDRGKQRLDNSSPEDRAKRDQFRKDMENRRKQRGLASGGR